MSLEDEIKRLKPDVIVPSKRHDKYGIGYAEAQRKAAKIAAEADELMAEMAEAIGVMLETGFSESCEAVFEKYNNWKERTR